MVPRETRTVPVRALPVGPGLPALVLGVALDKPGQRPAYNGLKVLNRLRKRGYKPGYLADDRAYNNSDPGHPPAL